MKQVMMRISCIGLLFYMLGWSHAHAEMRIDGFASFVAGQVLDKDELGGGDYLGYTDKMNFQNESVFGIQFRSDLSEGLSATGQIVGAGENDYEAKVNWAFLKYDVDGKLNVKFGRQRLPFFLYSDFLDVGYAYSWVTPPNEVYDLSGFENIDGVNFEYTSQMGAWSSRLNFIYGASETTITSGANSYYITTKDFKDITWNMSNDWLTLQLTYSESISGISAYDQLSTALQQIMAETIDNAPAFAPFAITDEELDLLTINEDESKYIEAGVAVDMGDWLAAFEYTHAALENAPTSEDRNSWYVMGGYRWNAYTFVLTYAEFENPNVDEVLEILDRFTPLTADPEVAAALAGADKLYRIGNEAQSYTLSMRYDFHPSAAFKVEYNAQTADYEYAPGNVTTREPSFIRMGLDLVF